MAADEDWDDWMNKFLERVIQILVNEGAKKQLKPLVIPTQLPENDQAYTMTVTHLTSGNQFADTVMKPQKGNLKPNSIGQINEASLLV
jgi:hypothetical protein